MAGGCVKRFGDEECVLVGTFTLCQVCHFAIVLVLETWPDVDTGEQVQWERWIHTGQAGCGVHDPEPPKMILWHIGRISDERQNRA